MTPVRVLVDSFADKDLPNAQMSNAREIISRLDPARFRVSVFVLGEPDTSIAQRPNTRLIPLPSHGQTPRIFREFALGNYDMLFYLKSAPATKWYMRLPLIFNQPVILRRNSAPGFSSSAPCDRSKDHSCYSMLRHAFPTPILSSLARGQWRRN